MNKYNPNIHHRRSIRLKGYDYSQVGAYFITICCDDRICRFGEIAVGAGLAPAQMILNELGQIAHNEWLKLSERFTNFELDVFQIMPNHIHGIIVLNNVGASHAVTQNGVIAQNDAVAQNDNAVAQNAVAQNDNVVQNDAVAQNDNIQNEIINDGDNYADIRAGASPAPTVTVFDIVGAYKSLVANGCLKIYKSKNETMGKLWQRNYHEQIIRNEQSYQTISNYIINNPSKWNDDKFYNK